MRSTDDIAAARILALGLAGPALGSPADAARHLVCLQGQALPGALVSMALRTADREPATVAAALADGSVVRSWTQRGTIHLVSGIDLGWILDLTAERMLKQAAKRRAALGIDDAMFDAAANLVTDLIRDQGPVSRAALLTALDPLGIGDVPGREYHLITMLAMRQVVVQGPLADGARAEQLYVLCDDWLGPPRELDRAEAVAEFMTRYAVGHGPVTVADAARWTGLTRSDARTGLRAGGETGALTTTEIDDAVYFHAADLADRLADHRQDAERVMLLPGFDELILGYQDRTATLTAADERLVVPGGNGIFMATVIAGARAVGTWVRSTRSTGPRVLVSPFPRRRINRRTVEQVARDHPAFATM